MKLMVIGGGGREHAIIKKLKENPAVEKIYCLPGNGGIAADAVCVSEIGAKDIPAQVEFAKAHGIDYAVVAPDDPLALGAVDALSEAGIPSGLNVGALKSSSSPGAMPSRAAASRVLPPWALFSKAMSLSCVVIRGGPASRHRQSRL